ncbi:MAG: hypothetical protein E6J59_05280 [Deltaproteobacteria bacterium]|nr:MAG: hypothetical protein E6J59_05280 [Deltaproteobacteria bacterium]
MPSRPRHPRRRASAGRCCRPPGRRRARPPRREPAGSRAAARRRAPSASAAPSWWYHHPMSGERRGERCPRTPLPSSAVSRAAARPARGTSHSPVPRGRRADLP